MSQGDAQQGCLACPDAARCGDGPRLTSMHCFLIRKSYYQEKKKATKLSSAFRDADASSLVQVDRRQPAGRAPRSSGPRCASLEATVSLRFGCWNQKRVLFCVWLFLFILILKGCLLLRPLAHFQSCMCCRNAQALIHPSVDTWAGAS